MTEEMSLGRVIRNEEERVMECYIPCQAYEAIIDVHKAEV